METPQAAFSMFRFTFIDKAKNMNFLMSVELVSSCFSKRFRNIRDLRMLCEHDEAKNNINIRKHKNTREALVIGI